MNFKRRSACYKCNAQKEGKQPQPSFDRESTCSFSITIPFFFVIFSSVEDGQQQQQQEALPAANVGDHDIGYYPFHVLLVRGLDTMTQEESVRLFHSAITKNPLNLHSSWIGLQAHFARQTRGHGQAHQGPPHSCLTGILLCVF